MKRQLRRGGMVCVILVMFSFLAPQMVQAQEYPTKPVTVVIPFAPGGLFDLTARGVMPVAEKYLGQPIIIQYRPGGTGAIASLQVAKAAPDGYTLLLGGTAPNIHLPAIQGRSAGPDDLEAVCRLAFGPAIWVRRLDAPFKTFKEMMQYAKGNPNKLIFASSGPWGPSDIGAKMVMKETGITFKIVPYEGAGPALIAVMAGHADMTQHHPSICLPYVKAGKIAPLVMLTEERHHEYPDLPTAKELGVRAKHSSWTGILAPKGTPPQIINKLAEAFKKMMEDGTTKDVCKRLGVDILYMGPDETKKSWRLDYQEDKELAKYFKK